MKNYTCQNFYYENTTNAQQQAGLFTNTLNKNVYLRDLRVMDNSTSTSPRVCTVWLGGQYHLTPENHQMYGGDVFVLTKTNLPITNIVDVLDDFNVILQPQQAVSYTMITYDD